jgi:excisionase family DNA binding protein
MTTSDREIMTTQELSVYINVPVTTIYGWRYKGDGPRAMRVGRHLRFRRRDVESWLDRQSGPEEG